MTHGTNPIYSIFKTLAAMVPQGGALLMSILMPIFSLGLVTRCSTHSSASLPFQNVTNNTIFTLARLAIDLRETALSCAKLNVPAGWHCLRCF
jgi:hypothetical protein